ncbi:hypothetical protein NTE_00346 [Candidatus Nitrososphaera evergladensis SR1]|uniref:Uncharacterized protein n=1 Tax=Candidatus Nitrososphaera evergladensis SR1 TaxID=1459636 RepID=A0A075MME9_9ARCH|nr:hypothetical protein NTE_00346 [Candidatus Nitrososphaera evergladensis SR1]
MFENIIKLASFIKPALLMINVWTGISLWERGYISILHYFTTNE